MPHPVRCLLAVLALSLVPVSSLAQSSGSEEADGEAVDPVPAAAQPPAQDGDRATLVYREEKAYGLIEAVTVFVFEPSSRRAWVSEPSSQRAWGQRAWVEVVVDLRDTDSPVELEVYLNGMAMGWLKVPVERLDEGRHAGLVPIPKAGRGELYVRAIGAPVDRGANPRVLDGLGSRSSPRRVELRQGAEPTTLPRHGAAGPPPQPLLSSPEVLSGLSSPEVLSGLEMDRRNREMRAMRRRDTAGWVFLGTVVTTLVAAHVVGGAYDPAARVQDVGSDLESADLGLGVANVWLGATAVALSYVHPSDWRWRAYAEAADDARRGGEFEDALKLRGLRWKGRGQLFAGSVSLGLGAGQLAAGLVGLPRRGAYSSYYGSLVQVGYFGVAVAQAHVMFFSAMANFIRADRLEQRLGWTNGVPRTRAVRTPSLDLVPYLDPAGGAGGLLAVGRF